MAYSPVQLLSCFPEMGIQDTSFEMPGIEQLSLGVVVSPSGKGTKEKQHITAPSLILLSAHGSSVTQPSAVRSAIDQREETDLNEQRENRDDFQLAFSAGLSSNQTSATPGKTQPSSCFLGPVTPTEAQISSCYSWWLDQSTWVDTENSWEFCGLGYKAGKNENCSVPCNILKPTFYILLSYVWCNDQFWLSKAGICVFSCYLWYRKENICINSVTSVSKSIDQILQSRQNFIKNPMIRTYLCTIF